MLIIPRMWITGLREGIPAMGWYLGYLLERHAHKRQAPLFCRSLDVTKLSSNSPQNIRNNNKSRSLFSFVQNNVPDTTQTQRTRPRNTQRQESQSSFLHPLALPAENLRRNSTQQTLANNIPDKYAIHHHFNLGFPSHRRLGQHLHTLLRRFLHHRHPREHGKRLLWGRVHSP